MNRIKITCWLFGGLLLVAGCSTTKPAVAGNADPETVMVTYHVKPGREAELQATLAGAWEIYQRKHMVLTETHVVVRGTEDGGKTRFVEIFTWVSHSAPDHAPEAVKQIWTDEESLCEARNGHPAIGGGEVEIVGGK